MEFEKINLLSTLNKKDVDTLMDLYYTNLSRLHFHLEFNP